MSHLRRVACLALALAPGCGELFLETIYDTSAAELRVDDLDPGHGPTSGRTEVAITGAGFTGDVSVRFGNSAGDVTVVDANNLSVLAPDAEGMAITVDVTVSASGGEVTVDDGFVYTDDTMPDDTATGIDGVGGVVEFSHLQVACTQCFGATSPQVSAFAAFHQPVDSTWTGWLPDPGACVANPSNSPPVSSFLDLGPFIHLNASGSLALTRTTVAGDIQYDAGSLTDADFQRNTAYDLVADENDTWGPFTVVDAVTTGQMITDIAQPALGEDQEYSLILTQPNQAFVRGLLNYPIVYSPYGGDGTFVVILGFYSSDDASFLGQVVCRDYDNGTFTLHQGYANAYPARSLVAVYMYRYLITWTPNEASGSYIESAVSIGVVGTASI